MINITITGASGKMACAILNLLDSEKYHYKDYFNISALVSSKSKISSALNYTNNLDEAIKVSDVIIDFTSPTYAMQVIRIAANYKKKVVSGTTGFSDNELKEIQELAKIIPIFYAPNMSFGAHVVSLLAKTAVTMLKNSYMDLSIIEHHHREKLDSPSGTAKNIASLLSEVTGYKITNSYSKRNVDEIQISSIRGGTVVGNHQVLIDRDFERVSISYEAHDRLVYAKGALDATRFISKIDTAGLYKIDDLLMA